MSAEIDLAQKVDDNSIRNIFIDTGFKKIREISFLNETSQPAMMHVFNFYSHKIFKELSTTEYEFCIVEVTRGSTTSAVLEAYFVLLSKNKSRESFFIFKEQGIKKLIKKTDKVVVLHNALSDLFDNLVFCAEKANQMDQIFLKPSDYNPIVEKCILRRSTHPYTTRKASFFKDKDLSLVKPIKESKMSIVSLFLELSYLLAHTSDRSIRYLKSNNTYEVLGGFLRSSRRYYYFTMELNSILEKCAEDLIKSKIKKKK